MKNWQPTASIAQLQARAELLKQIRDFFFVRHVWEVETPLLSTETATDPHIHSFSLNDTLNDRRLYLQTSPEFAMKRLLAAGSGSIFQICKAFRSGESGHRHNPEFTILEWYRQGFDHIQLIDEVDQLLQQTLNIPAGKTTSYQACFMQHLQLDPLTANEGQLLNCADHWQLPKPQHAINNRDDWLDYLFSQLIMPKLGQNGADFIDRYPASQAALARLDKQNPKTALRFEAFVHGVELANGYHELTDATEQANRISADNQQRKQQQQTELPTPHHLLGALNHGLPDCAGVALGIDRLLLLKLNRNHINQTLSFDWENA